jgi:hypothetical protein
VRSTDSTYRLGYEGVICGRLKLPDADGVKGEVFLSNLVLHQVPPGGVSSVSDIACDYVFSRECSMQTSGVILYHLLYAL